MIRPASPDERDLYVRGVWVTGLLRGRRCPRRKRDQLVHRVERLLETQRTDVFPGPGTDGRDVDVLAWICWTPTSRTGVVHYLYCRRQHRGQLLQREHYALRLLEYVNADPAQTLYRTFESPLLDALAQQYGGVQHVLDVRDVVRL